MIGLSIEGCLLWLDKLKTESERYPNNERNASSTLRTWMI